MGSTQAVYKTVESGTVCPPYCQPPSLTLPPTFTRYLRGVILADHSARIALVEGDRVRGGGRGNGMGRREERGDKGGEEGRRREGGRKGSSMIKQAITFRPG